MQKKDSYNVYLFKQTKPQMNNSFYLTFFIRKSRKKNYAGKCTIYLRLTYKGQRIESSTNLKIEHEKWSKTQHKAIGNSENSRTTNSCLEDLRNRIYTIYSNKVQSGEPFFVYDLHAELIGKNTNKETLIQLIKLHNAKKKDLIGVDIVKATWDRYETLSSHISSFLKHQYNIEDIALSKFTYSCVVEFEHYLKTEKNIGHNTTLKYLRNLQSIINYGIDLEWIVKTPFSKYKSKLKEVKRGYLTKEELQLLEDKEFVNSRISNVRDIFLFCCYTGLAYSDILSLTMDQINMGIDGEQWIKTYRKKTKNQVNIPLLPKALEIIKKYASHPKRVKENVALPVLSNQKMNNYLKEIGDLCGINKNLTTHLARHTFATTITLQQGISIESVSKMLGHSDIKTTQIYAKITDTKVSSEMQQLRTKLSQKEAVKNIQERKIS